MAKLRVPTEKEIAKKHGVSVDYVIRQAEVGSTVEREHVTTHQEAYGIALQHIAEFPDYYKHLLKMEKKLKGEWKNGKKAVKEEKEEVRYCHICEKPEKKSECSYGPSAWEMNTSLLNMQEDHKEIASGKIKDHEGYMANLEMDQMERSIEMLRKIIRKSNQQLPAWVQSKITRAADFIDTAAEYLSSDAKISEQKSFSQFMNEADNVSFQIGSGHSAARRQAKIRNLADRTTSAGEESAAKSKLKGPDYKKPKPQKNVYIPRSGTQLNTEGAAWTKKSGKSPSGGLNEKGRRSYERENPGSDLKPPQPEGGPRKKSFCARMGGNPGPMKDEKGRPTRKALALRKWKC
jgi:hypothetical protein